MKAPIHVVLLLMSLLVSNLELAAQQDKKPDSEKPRTDAGVELRFVDGSSMKVQLRDVRLTLDTRFGQLVIPVAEIQRIDFALRMTAEESKRVEIAIADLGSKDYQRRQKASADLLALKEKAYTALLRAAKSTDTEAARRAEQVLDKLRETLPAEDLEIPEFDIVHTADSKIAGRIATDALQVATLPFGNQQVKLADIRTLSTPKAVEPETAAGNALPDPGTLGAFQGNIGQTFAFRVTAPPLALMANIGVFGTDVYTTDSALAGAAVHAGVLQPGQTGIVRVRLVGPQGAFQPSTRNGVQSYPYGPWPGYRIEPARARAGN